MENKAITELYQPGSVFKVITASAGFEESVIKLTDTFNCTGGVVVVDGVPLSTAASEPVMGYRILPQR